jgi:TPR repeat protein
MSIVGELYELGRGVSKNDREAAHWYRKGSEAGANAAMLHLGRLQAEGRGIEKNETAARDLFRKAAETQSVEHVWKAAVSVISDPDFGLHQKPYQTATLMLLTLAAGSSQHRDRLIADAAKIPVPVRMAVQSQLKSAGHYKGVIDGHFGPVTKKSLETWAATQQSTGRRAGN